MPLVSVVMPALNAERFIGEAIKSVLAQTLTDWELLIADDGSTDTTAAIVARAAALDHRIIQIPPGSIPSTAALARNRCLDNAQGKFVAFLDSDDYWAADKLARQISLLETTRAALTYGAYQRVSETGKNLGLVVPPDVVTFTSMLATNDIGNLTGIYSRDVLPDLRFEPIGNEDYLFWLRALSAVRQSAPATPGLSPLASYRVRKGSLSANKLRSAGRQWRVYRQSLGLGLRRSAFYFASYAFCGVRKRLAAGIRR